MLGRRIAYLLAAAGCLVFYIAYREWLSWFLLAAVLALPWLSLLLSLPAMLTVRVAARCPAWVEIGQETFVTLTVACPLPEPPVRVDLMAAHALSGDSFRLKYGADIPTAHCGRLDFRPYRARVYDYLGLFRLGVRNVQGCALLVRPRPLAMDPPPDLTRYRANRWRPKPGGGFSENHEMRLYRPGDDLRHVHWKLSAKTGKLILREPMEPLRGLAVLTAVLSGTPEELDKKLGRLLWLSEYLLRQEVPHRVCCLTGKGLETFEVEREGDPMRVVDSLLAAPQAPAGARLPVISAAWQYQVGGDGRDL